MNVAVRAKAILVDPSAEWTKIETESGDVAYLLTTYVAALALIPALCGFIGVCLVGVVVPGPGTLRAPILQGLFGAVFGYVMACATVVVLGIVIRLLVPIFGGRRSFDRAFKLAVYSCTPFWLAGLFLLAPGLRFLILTSLYGVYLLWKGLPRLMETPKTKIASFTAVIVGCACVLTLIIAAAQHALFGLPAL